MSGPNREVKECSRDELLIQFENGSQSIINDVLRINGGNIDGGGTDLEYPSFKEIKDSLNEALNLVTTTKEGENLIQHLRDSYPSYREGFSLLSEKLDPHSTNEHFLQLIVGDRFRTLADRYYDCKFHGKGYREIYTESPIVFKLTDCQKVSMTNHSPFKPFLLKTNIEFKDKCFDQNGVEKLGSVSEFSLNAEICLSKSKFLKIPKKNLLRIMTSVLLHEVSHMFKSSEDQAKEFEDFVSSQFLEKYNIIKNLDLEIKDRRDEAKQRFYLLSLKKDHQSFSIQTSFDSYSFEFIVSDLLKEILVPRQEILFLLPFASADNSLTLQREIIQHIEEHFDHYEGEFIVPKKSFLTLSEMHVYYGLLPLNSSAGKSFKNKIKTFLKTISEKSIEIARNFLNAESMPLTNRIDVMSYYDKYGRKGVSTLENEALFYGDFEYFRQLRVDKITFGDTVIREK